jgi:hypothetical protein
MQNDKQIVDKVLFLDVDGVLNSKLYYKNSFNPNENHSRFDAYSVFLIKQLIEEFSLKIVITSTWRAGMVDKLMSELKRNELLTYLHKDSFTPVIRLAQRGEEIKAWLAKHPEITEFVIIDDNENMLEEQKTRFVKTDIFAGLLDENYYNAREILLAAESVKK